MVSLGLFIITSYVYYKITSFETGEGDSLLEFYTYQNNIADVSKYLKAGVLEQIIINDLIIKLENGSIIIQRR